MTLNNCWANLVKCFGFAACVLMATGGFADDKVDFVKQIKPILEKHCISCHGPEKEESFRIDVRDDAMGYIEESAEDSDFYNVLIDEDEEVLMPPPDDGIPMTPEQIALVKTWIDEGADWPEDVELVDTSKEEQTPAEPETKDEPKTETTPADKTPTDTTPADAKTAESKPADSKPDDNGGDEKQPEQPVNETTQRVYNAIGSLHPAAVHLPIGLLLASGFFALLSLRGNFVMSDCAYYCLWLGAITAIFATASGWWFSPMEKRGTVEVFADLFDQDQKVFWHRTGGLIVTAAALLLAIFAAGARNRDPDDGMMWKLGLILLAAGIGWVGHTGGKLHYPSDHYKDLNALYQGIVDPDAAPVEKPAGGNNDGAGKANEPAKKDSVGEVSEPDTTENSSPSDDNQQVAKAAAEKGENITSIDKDMKK